MKLKRLVFREELLARLKEKQQANLNASRASIIETSFLDKASPLEEDWGFLLCYDVMEIQIKDEYRYRQGKMLRQLSIFDIPFKQEITSDTIEDRELTMMYCALKGIITFLVEDFMSLINPVRTFNLKRDCEYKEMEINDQDHLLIKLSTPMRNLVIFKDRSIGAGFLYFIPGLTGLFNAVEIFLLEGGELSFAHFKDVFQKAINLVTEIEL